MKRASALVFAALAAAAFLAGAAGAAEMAAYIGAVEGRVSVQLDGIGPWSDAKGGEELTPGTPIRTRANSSAVIVFSDGTKIRLGPDCDFKTEETSPAKVSVFMGLGRLEAWVKKLAGRSFQARTPTAVAAVRGTVFIANVISPTQTEIETYEGTLGVVSTKGGPEVSLGAGNSLQASDAGLSKPATLPPAKRAPAEPKVDLKKIVPQEKAGKKEEKKAPAETPAPAETATQPPPPNPIQNQTITCTSPASGSTPICQ